jgi:hypothetical protein
MPTITKKQAKELGYPKNKLILHTVLISNTGRVPDGSLKKITMREMKKWLKENNYKSDNHRLTANFHRFLQTEAIEGATYKTKKLSPYLELIFQKY